MASEFRLSYTAADINERLGKIDSFANKSEIPSKLSELTNDRNFATEDYVNNAVANIDMNYIKTVNGVAPDENGNVEIEMPESGGNVDLGVTGATVGQVVAVKSVDEIGKPIEFEAVDMQKSDNKLDYVAQDTPPEDTSILWIDTSDNSDDGFQTDVGYPDWSHLKWYVMGDSLTAKPEGSTEKRYYDFVQEKTGIQLIVDGVGGTGYGAGVSTGQSFLDRVINIPEDVDIVSIFGSGNDIRYGVNYNKPIYDTLSWIALNRPGLRVIVAPPPAWKSIKDGDGNIVTNYDKRGDLWKPYCDRVQVCALACDFRYLAEMYDCPPFNPNFTGHMEKFFTTDPEGIHPNEAGHEALATYFYNALAQELEFDNGHVVSSSCGGISVTGAKVGQTVMISEVDENGTPTAWEPVDLQSEKDIVIYRNQNEVPLESGSEYIVYGSGSGTVTFNIGEEWANQKYECVLEDRNSSIRLLWVQTADTQGSFITSSGTRQAIDLYGDVSKIKITSTVSTWIVIKIG